MTNLAGILGMPIQAGPSGPAGGAAPPPGAFDALVAESVAADATAESGATGHERDWTVPVLPPSDGSGEGATGVVPLAGTGKAVPGGALPGVMLPGLGARVSNPLGMTDVPEPDAAEGLEEDADEAGSGWLLCAPVAPLMVLRDDPVTPAASGAESASPAHWRDVPVGTPAWITGSVTAARRDAVEAAGAGASLDGASEEPVQLVADPGIEGPDAATGAPQARTGGGLDPVRGTGVASSPGVPAPPTAPPGVPPPARTPIVSPQQATPPENTASAATDPRPHARPTTADTTTPGTSAVQPGAGADVAVPAGQAASNAGHDAGKEGPRAIPVASAVPVDRPAVEVPEAGEPAVRIFDVPPGPSGGTGDFSGDGSGPGQRDGQQAGAHPSQAVIAHAVTQSAETFNPATPAAAAAPPDAEVARLAADVGEGVTQQIVQSLRTQLRGGIGEAVIRLKPEHLGEVTINVRVERGAVEATVTASLPAVREWLEAQEPLVRQHLADQGLSLTRLRVEPDGSSPDGGRGAGRDQEHAQRRRPRPHGEPSARFDVLV